MGVGAVSCQGLVCDVKAGSGGEQRADQPHRTFTLSSVGPSLNRITGTLE